MSEKNNFKVRDSRRPAMFRVDDAYLNGYARICGIAATGVYVALCRHADKQQECWPSVRTIADKLGLSVRTVIRAIKTLEEQNIIAVAREKNEVGRQKVNVYVLVDKTEWLRVTPGKPAPGDKNDIEPGDKNDKSRVTPGKRKETILEGYTEDEGIAAPCAAGIVSVFEAFQKSGLNPHINYGNKTQREAAAFLIKTYTLEKVLGGIAYAAQIAGQPYAPVITTPLEMKEKIGKLVAHSKRGGESKSITI